MHYDPDPSPPPQAVRERVSVPGIFLAVAGLLNVIASLYVLASGSAYLRLTEQEQRAQVRESWQRLPPEWKKVYEDQGIGEEEFGDLLKKFINGATWWAGLGAVVGLVGLLGGIRMVRLRGYGLAMTGAILTAIPFISPCCLVGQIVGLWAMIVLMSTDVRAAFNAAPPPPPEEPLRL